MAIILNIETSTKNCSVSIADKGEILAIKELNDGNYSHAEKLHPFINEILGEAKVSRENIAAVAVSKGPGSYTGLRIGVSAAKGLCFSLDVPLIATDTLKTLAMQMEVEDGYIVPMIDARRMEVYAAVFAYSYEQKRETRAEIIESDSFASYLASKKVYFLGDGANKCKEIIKHENAVFIADKFPSAAQMAVLSYEKFKRNIWENVAYFEPFYLKNFIVTPQKK